ncbi:MAG: hypothetical protein Q8W51_04425 [Candidatus Palauibacterales bacterium]|nr:hypothetical protein [Candidatus Palauibacterales bacterium]MDP2528959.1 hypothetical protein [Candidatus Palauibacterales bacterium]MDP2584710.1 hypothetical protein [Candidatus Palauibacterales bacterium]
MSAPRTSGAGRRFELVLMRLNPPTPRTVALIAKHASRHSYHWLLMAGRSHGGLEPLARLLAVAYLDEASSLLGRGDPRWAVPRAYLRPDGRLHTRDRPRPDDPGLPDDVESELARIAVWLRARHAGYLSELSRALREGATDERFVALTRDEARLRGFADPTGRSLLAPPPPPVVTRTVPDAPRSAAPGGLDTAPGGERTGARESAWRLPWNRFGGRSR